MAEKGVGRKLPKKSQVVLVGVGSQTLEEATGAHPRETRGQTNGPFRLSFPSQV